MLRAAPLILLLWLASFAAASTAAAADLSYTLYVLAVPLADAVFSLDLTPSGYGLALRFHTTGLADVVASDRLEEFTRGRFENDRMAPSEYGSKSRLHGHDRAVGLVWRDGTPVATEIVPPNATERDEVPQALLPATIDPLSAIVLLIRQVARTGRCDAASRTYDGRHLSLFTARTTGDEDVPPTSRSTFAGRALRCDFTEQIQAGFRLGPGRADDATEHRGKLWLARIFPNGPLLPVRASVETQLLGDATVFLTAATP